MLTLLCTLLLASGPVLASATPPARSTPVAQDRRSLEELLAEERAAAAAQVEALRPEVTNLLSSLRGLGGAKPGDQRIQQIIGRLAQLGSPGAVLLMESLDPGAQPTKEDLFLADHVATALLSLPTAAVTAQLLELSEAGSPRGRAAAVRVLGATGAPERVGPHLARLYHEVAELRTEALGALCLLGGRDADLVLAELLTGDGAEVGAALEALTTSLRLARPVTPSQLGFLRDLLASDLASDHVAGVLAFGRALGPGQLGEPEAELLVQLAANRKVDRKQRIALLDALPALALPWDRDLTRLLEGSRKSSFEELSLATLVCLSRYGDKGARKDLLDPYKDRIRDEKDEPGPLEERGALLVRIRDLEGAVADYKKAIKLYEDQEQSPYASNKARIGLAKALVLDGQNREASKALEDSALSTVQLRALATDPDFAGLVADDRYRDVLRLRD